VFRITLQILSQIFLIRRRPERDIIINVRCLHVKCPSFLSDLNEKWLFSKDFLKIIEYETSWKSIHLEHSCVLSLFPLISSFRLSGNIAWLNYSRSQTNHYTLSHISQQPYQCSIRWFLRTHQDRLFPSSFQRQEKSF
jgi:hypothetical protein